MAGLPPSMDTSLNFKSGDWNRFYKRQLLENLIWNTCKKHNTTSFIKNRSTYYLENKYEENT